jgi:acetyl esterase/lipase
LVAAALAALLVAPAAASATAEPEPFSPWTSPMRLEWRGPADARAGVVLLHPGAWWLRAPDATAVLRPQADRFAARGLLTVNVDYRNGIYGVADARAAFDALARRLPAGAPICVFGESAGGHLALLLARRRPVACLAVRAPVVTPHRLRADGCDPDLWRFARLAFARRPGGMRRLDVLAGDPVLPPTVVSQAVADPVVPLAQSRRLATASSRVRLLTVRPGPVPFIHADGDEEDTARVIEAEDALVARATAATAP